MTMAVSPIAIPNRQTRGFWLSSLSVGIGDCSTESGHSANGPPPAKLRPFSLWPIMAEENEDGLFEI